MGRTHLYDGTRLTEAQVSEMISTIMQIWTHLFAFLCATLGLTSVGVNDGDTGNFVGHGGDVDEREILRSFLAVRL